jgi:hypothetical protein
VSLLMVDSRVQEIVDRAMAWPMDDVLERYRDDHNIPEDVALEHEREIKRYLALCSINPEAKYGMKGVVDELWHTFILFTREYATFCEAVAGRFIHHAPTPKLEKLVGAGAGNYAQMLADYVIVFGEESPVHLWPRLHNTGGNHEAPACTSCGGSCSMECSSCGNSGGGTCSDD